MISFTFLLLCFQICFTFGAIPTTTGYIPNDEISILKNEIKEIKLYLFELKNIIQDQDVKINEMKDWIENTNKNYVAKEFLIGFFDSLGPCNDNSYGDLCELTNKYNNWS
jgi:hypothetical protein